MPSARQSIAHVATAPRAENLARPPSSVAGRPAARPGALRPSQVPISAGGRRPSAPLIITPVDDAGEREADRAADEVMRGAPAQPVPVRSLPAVSAAGTTAPGEVDEVLAGSGRPLYAGIRTFMESRFARDLRHVRVHDDAAAAASARSLDAVAYTAGYHIVSAVPVSGQSPRGRRLLAHELAHVVQQDAAAAGPAARSAWHIQRFTEPGHKLIGDTAFGDMLSLGDVQLTFGDAVALGDYFRSFQYVRELAAKPGIGRGTRGVLQYVLWVKIHRLPKSARLGKLYDQGAIDQAEQISRMLDSSNISHFPNPRTGDTALTPLQKNQRVGPDGKPLGAAATYRQAHEEAMAMAYLNGTLQRGNDDALLADGFACHFLTDSFSASHLRTPRASIKAYWDAQVPGFRHKLIGYLADQIDRQPLSPIGPVSILERVFAVTGFPGVHTPNATVRVAAEEKLSILLSGGDFSFGDVVSLIAHDSEGAAGVEAVIEGKRLRLAGDKDLVQGRPADPLYPEGQQLYSFGQDDKAAGTARAAVAAVKASLEDIFDAYSAGLPENLGTQGLGYAGFGDLSRTTHHEDFGAFTKRVRGPQGLYRAERLMPTAVPDKDLPEGDRTVPWAQGSVGQLLADDNRRIGRALAAFGQAEGEEFETRLEGVPDLLPQHRAALKRALVDPLKSADPRRIRALLKAILAGPKADPQVESQGVSVRQHR